MPRRMIFLAALMFLIGVACQSPTPVATQTVTVMVDGTSQVIAISTETTVSDVLRGLDITWDELDRINPPPHSRIDDGMTIRIVRVDEETHIEQEVIPFQRQTVPNDTLPAGETRLLQPGTNGMAEVTYRITYEDGVEVARNQIRSFVLTPPKDEIVMVGSQGELPTVTVNGTLAYISGGNAWIIRQNSANKRPLTQNGGVDGRVFEVSEDNRRLLFTISELPVQGQETPEPVQTTSPNRPFNTLWAVFDTTIRDSNPVRLDLNNVLYADWVPGMERTIVYSTGEPRPGWPGWQANNDLWTAQISANGSIIRPRQLLDTSGGGIYSFYGTFFDFGPDGVMLAWSRPDAVGVLQPDYTPLTEGEGATPTAEPTFEAEATAETGPTEEPELPEGLPPAYISQTLASFAPRNAYDFVWVPGLAWSPDGRIIISTLHGAPLGAEAPEDSPVFNVVALPVDGTFQAELVRQAGMWSLAQYAPLSDESLGGSLIAYLEAINPLDSVVSRYQLVVLDQDGSNRRVVFPTEDQPGLLPRDFDYRGFAWSPDGRQIALIYQGNLYLVDVVTGLAQQITQDGQARSPRWMP